MVKKGVIFDYGGVFVHSSDEALFEAIGAAFSIEASTAIREIHPLMGPFFRGKITEAEFWDQFSTVVDRPLPESYENLWTSQMSYCLPDPAMVGLQQRVKNEGYKTVVLSDIIDPLARFLEQRGDFSIFDGQVLSCDIGHKKPEPEGYLRALEILGCEPDETFFIDDKTKYILGAQHVGIRGYQYVRDPSDPRDSMNRLVAKLQEEGYNI